MSGIARECLKMSGLGNDFVVIDNRRSPIAFSRPFIRRIADRSTGIGCDQVIVLENQASVCSPRPLTPPMSSTTAPTPSPRTFMRMFNGSTGDEAGACGNASRCIAHLLMDEAPQSNAVEFATISGTISAWRECRHSDVVSVDMGVPRLEWHEIPLSCAFDTARVPVDIAGLPPAVAVNVGNPHLVFIMDDLPSVEIVEERGPSLETHAILPERANISFCRVDKGTSSISVLTYERDAGLTLACGTGACASVVACVRRRQVALDVTMRVTMRGGVLDVVWRADRHVVMTGAFTYEGTREIPREWILLQ